MVPSQAITVTVSNPQKVGKGLFSYVAYRFQIQKCCLTIFVIIIFVITMIIISRVFFSLTDFKIIIVFLFTVYFRGSF